MGMSITLREYLNREGLEYDVTTHDHTHNSRETLRASNVPGERLAKSVLLEDEAGYVLAVVPANHRVEIGRLGKTLDRHLGMATEDEVGEVFGDCEIGAIPPVGQAYGLEVVVDESVTRDNPDIYFEAGDHEALIHMDVDTFRKLMDKARHGRFSHPR